MYIVRLKFRQTSERGFLVTLAHHQQQLEIEGFLPALPEALRSAFEQWQSAYRQLEDVRSCISPKPGFRLTPKSMAIGSNTEYANAVKIHLDRWLNEAHSDWQPIRDGLISLANHLHQTEVQLIVDTQDIDLRRLPWQEWDLLEKYYSNSEVALCTAKTQYGAIARIHPHLNYPKPRILVVVGRSNGINTQSDLEVIKNLADRGAEAICLLQPNLKELCEALWDKQGYHIFVFTGHSGSLPDGKIGWIEVNDRESLSIEEFRDALKEAINKGLQLAIFNSCDGLGLADRLAQLDLPQSIVMREPVPDEVAVEFLKHFFQEFVNNQSLFAAVQKAKKRLEPFRSSYPGAVWLPTICIQPAVRSLTWQGIFDRDSKSIAGTASKLIKKVGVILIASLLSFAIGLTTNLMEPPVSSATNYPAKIKSIDAIPEGTWQYSGSTTWEPIREQLERKIKRDRLKFQPIYMRHPTLPSGSRTGIKMLLDGEISFAQSSRPISDREYDLAAQRGVKLQQVPVAIDGIAVVVRPDLKLAGLTIQQLQAIYTGKIKNWSQVGGPDLEIIPYSRSTESGTTEFFQENILEERNFGNNVIFVADRSEALLKVSDPNKTGGIYFASVAEIVGHCEVKPLPISRRHGSVFINLARREGNSPEKCNRHTDRIDFAVLQNGEYPLARRLFVIIEHNNPMDEQAGQTYAKLLLTNEGQQAIEKAGFLPLRSF
ncbi:MAG: substrate-binding domain-containing protein [Cyanosarcina radialis HA8281-LM2]|jgi:ABC-type phosphate transport system substrate-binding protein|nr:substrate-binding domain-containing protein [Cyanosarcina radialis HA8281-LM2]